MKRFKMNKCIIILPYIEKYTDEYLIQEIQSSDYVICADGGQTIAKNLCITPDCVIGDFDSTKEDIKLACKYISYPAEKDLTDGEACLLHAIKLGYCDITFLGGIGGRLDHMMGALSLLLIGYKNCVNVVLKDMKNQVRLIDESLEIEIIKDIYKYFSLYPVNYFAEIEYIKDAKYNLKEPTMLPKDSTLCISNEVLGYSARLKLRSGLAYLIQSND